MASSRKWYRIVYHCVLAGGSRNGRSQPCLRIAFDNPLVWLAERTSQAIDAFVTCANDVLLDRIAPD
jgi:hypothetical protein